LFPVTWFHSLDCAGLHRLKLFLYLSLSLSAALFIFLFDLDQSFAQVVRRTLRVFFAASDRFVQFCSSKAETPL